MCGIIRGNGSHNARAEEQTHVADSRQVLPWCLAPWMGHPRVRIYDIIFLSFANETRSFPLERSKI